MASTPAALSDDDFPVEELVLSCSVCQATLSEIYAEKQSNKGFHSGSGDDDGIVNKMWMASCSHVMCARHLEGGAPFHAKNTPPRARCPKCKLERNDERLKELYAIRGCGKDEYDLAIPSEYFRCPAVKLDDSGPGMSGMRFQYSALVRHSRQVRKRWKYAQGNLDVVEAKYANERDQRRHAQSKLQDMKERLQECTKIKAQLKRWEQRKPVINHYLGIVTAMAKDIEEMRTELLRLGYQIPERKYMMETPDAGRNHHERVSANKANSTTLSASTKKRRLEDSSTGPRISENGRMSTCNTSSRDMMPPPSSKRRIGSRSGEPFIERQALDEGHRLHARPIAYPQGPFVARERIDEITPRPVRQPLYGAQMSHSAPDEIAHEMLPASRDFEGAFRNNEPLADYVQSRTQEPVVAYAQQPPADQPVRSPLFHRPRHTLRTASDIAEEAGLHGDTPFLLPRVVGPPSDQVSGYLRFRMDSASNTGPYRVNQPSAAPSDAQGQGKSSQQRTAIDTTSSPFFRRCKDSTSNPLQFSSRQNHEQPQTRHWRHADDRNAAPYQNPSKQWIDVNHPPNPAYTVSALAHRPQMIQRPETSFPHQKHFEPRRTSEDRPGPLFDRSGPDISANSYVAPPRATPQAPRSRISLPATSSQRRSPLGAKDEALSRIQGFRGASSGSHYRSGGLGYAAQRKDLFTSAGSGLGVRR